MEQPSKPERDPTTINIMGAKLPVGMFLIGVAAVVVSGLLLWYLRDAPRAAEADAVRERMSEFAVAVVAGDGEAACSIMTDPEAFAAGFDPGVSCREVVSVIAASLNESQADELDELLLRDIRIEEERVTIEMKDGTARMVRAPGCEGADCWLLENPSVVLASAGIGGS